MNRTHLLGALLLGLGILALAYRGFTYTKDTDEVDLGPIHFEVTDRETVRIPLWIGVSAAVLGGALLAHRTRGHSS